MTRRRLRILCYHGFSLCDEHEFRPQLFICPGTFARRMHYLLEKGIPVLPLQKAMELLAKRALPHQATVVTIDDGFFSVFQLALPALIQSGFPATIYVTSYYVQKSSPIFRLVVQYMFWKTDRLHLWTEGLLPGLGEELDLRNERGRELWMWNFIQFGETHCDEATRCTLSLEMGIRLGVSYHDLIRNRSLSLMTPDEIRSLTANGMDVELHTHRHHFPEERDAALRELLDNNQILEPLIGKRCAHFCYPSGLWSRSQWPWLEEFGVQTAVTCEPGLNTPSTPALALRRFLDGENVSQIEFEAEVCGFAEILRNLRTAVFGSAGGHSAAD